MLLYDEINRWICPHTLKMKFSKKHNTGKIHLMSTLFSDFAELCEKLTSTTKKLEKISSLSEFLRSLNEKELEIVPLFILGLVFPPGDSRSLNVSWRTIQGIGKKVPPKAKSASLSILDVSGFFSCIALISGKGSRKQIDSVLIELFSRASKIERKYLIRIIFGEMRIGVAEGVLLEGIAKAANADLEDVRQAHMYLGDPGMVAKIALRKGGKELKKVNLRLFKPVQPMLAALAEDFLTVFKEHGGQSAFEIKFDGARVQIHKQKDKVKIYSRQLSDVTSSLPDLVEVVRKGIKADSIIIEGEVVAVGKNDRPLPFQELMRRFRRVHDIEQLIEEVPIKLFLFDLLYLNGESHIKSSYEKRWNLMQKHCNSELLAGRIVTADRKEAENFLRKSLKSGHEGLMVKKLDSIYTPGTRGKRWFKIKPAETLDVVIVAADWGSGRRKGWLSNYHLAVLDEVSAQYTEIGKTFKGLTDQQFKWITKKLLELKRKDTSYTVHVKPEMVVEVAYNEIQRSPQYESKFALRFARIKRIRQDKSPSQVDTLQRLQKLYEKQFERKARSESVD